MSLDTDLLDRNVIAVLNKLDVNGICGYLDRDPFLDTHYAVAPGWIPGTGRPMLADDDPAAMQALGICATSRVRWSVRPSLPVMDGLHRGECGWCSYPLPELLAACSWSVWSSRQVLSETMTWSGSNGSAYTRGGRHDVYENPAHALYWMLPATERKRLVTDALDASREGVGA